MERCQCRLLEVHCIMYDIMLAGHQSHCEEQTMGQKVIGFLKGILSYFIQMYSELSTFH